MTTWSASSSLFEPVSAISRRNLATVAGALYIAVIIGSLIAQPAFKAPFTDAAAIAAEPMRYRAGLLFDTAMFAAVLALSWALYLLLRPAGPGTALLALLFRVAEAVVGLGTVLLGLAAIDADVLLAARDEGMNITLIFLSSGTLLFCVLMWKSRMVPRWLSGLGMISFLLMGAGVSTALLLPAHTTALMATWAPGIVFEIGIGLWLLIKGVREIHE